MSNSKNSFRGILRRALAQLLAFLMIFGLAMSGMGVQNAYATELQPGGNNDGATEATAYTWKSSKGAGSEGGLGTTWRFDVRGLNTGETNYNNASIQTTYNNAGYVTWVIKADNPTAAAPSSHDYVDSHGTSIAGYKPIKPSLTNNGDVLTDTNLGIEYRQRVSPGPDGRSIIVDYYLHNTTNTTGRFWMGTGADSMINGDDYATCYKTPVGFHMVNRTTKETFDLITNDSTLGLTPPDTRWVGYYGNYWDNMFVEGTADRTNNVDSGVSYSWQIDLHPYETVHRRTAFLIKATSYYVSTAHGSDTTGEGTYQNPYATVQKAVDLLSGKKGYIYIIDYDGAPVNLNHGGNTDVVISQTDYEYGSSAVPYTGPTVEVTSSTPGTPLFTQTGTGKYTIEKLVVKGTAGRTAPVLRVSNGTLRLGTEASVQGATTTSTTSGAAIDVLGNGTLQLEDGSNVTGNVSPTNGRGAINYDGGKIKLAGSKPSGASVINVNGNTDGEGKPSNIYIKGTNKLSVMQSIAGSNIGVSKQAVDPGKDLPDAFSGVGTPTAAQEKNFAEPGTGVAASSVAPFSTFFTADQADKYGLSVADSATAANNAALRRAGYSLSFQYVDANGDPVPGAENRAAKSIAAGEPVDEAAPTVTPPSYRLNSIDTDESVASGATPKLTPDSTATSPNFGKVTGIMPKQDTVITYHYVRDNSSITFDAKGGTPTPGMLSGLAGDPTNALAPTVTKYGYDFHGWNKRGVSPAVPTAIPSTFPATPEIYDAIYTVNHNIKFAYTTSYENQNGSITFQTTTTPAASGFSVEDPLSGNRKVVPGYVWAPTDSFTNPSTYQFSDQTAPAPFGTFDTVAGSANYGKFTGRFPGQDAAVTWRYRVDPSHPGFQLKVNHVSPAGTVVAPSTTAMVKPEDPINISPVSTFGYTYDHYDVVAGNHANDQDPNPLVVALTGSADAAGNFTGVMPNQNVEINYVYTGAGTGQEFTLAHEDLGTNDSLLRNIVAPVVTPKATDDTVEGDPLAMPELYGYIYNSYNDNPVGVPIAGDATTFNTANNHYRAKMPTGDFKLSYRYTRDASAWTAARTRWAARNSEP